MSSHFYYPKQTIVQFLQAAATGDKNTLLDFINDGFHVDNMAEFDGFDGGVSALMLAARHCHAECVKLLIDFGADLGQVTQHYTKGIIKMSRRNLFSSAGFISLAAAGMLKVGVKDDGERSLCYEELINYVQSRDFTKVSIFLSKFLEQISIDDMLVDMICFLILSSCTKNIVDHFVQISKVDINGHNSHGFTPLISAVIVGNLEMVDYLLEKGVDVNAREDISCVEDLECMWAKTLIKSEGNDADDDECELPHGALLNCNGKSPLMFAIWTHSLEVVKRLLMVPELDRDSVDSDHQTVLVHAIYSGNLDAVNELRVHGLDVNYYQKLDNKNCDLYLFHAVNAKHDDITRSLIGAGVNKNAVDFSGKSVVMHLAEKGHADRLRLLLSHDGFDLTIGCSMSVSHEGFDLNIGCSFNTTLTAVMLAASKKHYDCLKLLIDHGASLDEEDNGGISILEYACQFSDERCVGLLLQCEDGSNQYDMQTIAACHIHSAVLNENIKVLELFLGYCININAFDGKNMTPLMYAATLGYIDHINLLLSSGAEVNLRFGNGNTAIWHAVLSQKLDAFKLLVQSGADVNCNKEHDHGPLLLHAAQLSDTEYLDILFQQGAKHINSQSQTSGFTPLIVAIRHTKLQNIQLLLKHGADVNLPDLDGSFATFHAARIGFADGLRVLMEAGADLNVVDKDGKTVISFALNYWTCLKILLEEGSVMEYDDKGFLQRRLKPVHTRFEVDHHQYWDVKVLMLLLRYGVFHWDWYDAAILNKLAFSSVCVKNNSPVLFKHANGRRTSLLQEAFLHDQSQTVRYLLANFFFTLEDYRALVSHSCNIQQRMKYLEDANPKSESVSIFKKFSRHPLRLETLCFLTVSSCLSAPLSPSSNLSSNHYHQRPRRFQWRSERVDSLSLPSVYKLKLKFESTVRYLCPRVWGSICKGEEYHLLSVLKPRHPHPDNLKECMTYCVDCNGCGFVIKDI